MTRTIGKILLLLTCVAVPVTSSAEVTSGNWENYDHQDDFDGLVKISVVQRGPSHMYIRETEGVVGIFIVPGDYICGALSNKLAVSFIIDGERLNDETLYVSDNSKGLFFSDKNIQLWVRRLNKGNSLKMRYTDRCGDTTTLEFDIRGHTRFDG